MGLHSHPCLSVCVCQPIDLIGQNSEGSHLFVFIYLLYIISIPSSSLIGAAPR